MVSWFSGLRVAGFWRIAFVRFMVSAFCSEGQGRGVRVWVSMMVWIKAFVSGMV